MRTRLGSFLALVALLSVVVAPISSSANPKGIPNANASGYWTEERRNNAIPREFEFEVGAKKASWCHKQSVVALLVARQKVEQVIGLLINNPLL